MGNKQDIYKAHTKLKIKHGNKTNKPNKKVNKTGKEIQREINETTIQKTNDGEQQSKHMKLKY